MKYLMVFSLLYFMITTACSPKYYTPNTQNVPLISEKGEVDLSLAGNGNQVEFQGAYGFSDNIAFKANVGLFVPPDLENGNGGSGRFLELGAGYYKKIGDKIVFESYGLLGFGNFENHFPTAVNGVMGRGKDISANIFRLGLQPNIGYKSDHFTIAASSRIVSLNYTGIEGDLSVDGVNQDTYLSENKSNLLIEPALTIKGGLERVKAQIQMGYSANLTNSDFRQDKVFLTAGLNFNF